MVISDPELAMMLMVKNNWSLSGNLLASKIKFGTRFYDENVQFPQLVIFSTGGSASPPIDFGSSDAMYPDFQEIGYEIYVRPESDSGKSIGSAKAMAYDMRKETERIFRSGSILTVTGNNEFIAVGNWDRKEDLSLRPVMFRVSGKTVVNKFIKGS